MKKTFVFLLAVLFLVLTFTASVHAEDSQHYYNTATGSGRPEKIRTDLANVKEKVGEKFENLKERIQGKREEVKERFASKSAAQKADVVNRIKKTFGVVILRLDKTVDRLSKISEKIQTRIDKLHTEGVDVSSVQTSLDACSTKKTAASSAIADAKSDVDAIDANSSNIRDAVHTAEVAAKTAREGIQDYRKCLVGVVKDLRALKPKEATESAE